MERTLSAVKQRAYNSSRRRQQAEATRASILDAAQTRFLRDGVSSTTIASIAEDVPVSVDTIYKTFGGKPGLVRAIAERALAAEGPVHAEGRSDALQASEADPHQIVRGFGALTADVVPRIAPVLLMLRQAAAVDTAMAGLWDELETQRLRRMTHNARNLAAGGHLRTGLTATGAGEIIWTYTSPELYERLVLKRRWSLRRYRTFVADALISALLPPVAPEAPSGAARSPTAVTPRG